LAVPAAAEGGVAADCLIEPGDTAVLEGELAAIEQAGACGREVEVIDQRDEFGTVVALPSGELKAEIGVEPIQAQDELGQWGPIDTTLEVAADGSVRPVNITEELAFSPGGTAPLAAVDYGAEGSFMLSWPGELPVPVLEGPQAIYNEVLVGVDLVVEATAQGFRYDLVVEDAEAAQNPDLEAIAFTVEASGVEVAETATGSVEVAVAGQAEMASGEALMWEAPSSHDGTETVPDLTAITDTPADPDQQVSSVDVSLEADDLVLRPDLDLLRGTDTRYPVVIDPEWDGGIQDNLWGLVNTKYPDSAFYRGKNTSGDYFMSNTGTWGNAGAGQTCDSWSGLDCYSSTYDMRSLFRMDTDSITQDPYDIPNKAEFKIVQRHSASCSNGTARIYRTGGYNSNDTWNTQPSWNESVTISSANKGATCDGSAYVSFNVTSMVKMADENEWANLTLGLRAPDESPSPELLQWNRFDSFTAVLEITYDILPYTVKLPQINGVEGSCTSVVADAPWINDPTPALSAVYSSKDTKIKYQLRVRSSTPVDQIVYEYTSGDLSDGVRQSKTVPENELEDGLQYWLSRAISVTNSDIASSWSAPCRFKLDATIPTTPTVKPTLEPPYSLDDEFTLTLSSTDTVVNGSASGITGFKYAWGTPANYASAPLVPSKPVATGSTTETVVVDTEEISENVVDATTGETKRQLIPGRHVLYAKAFDAAGNESIELRYTFFAGSDIVATPMAMWRLEGDTVDDTAEGNNLELGGGTAFSYTADRDGRATSAVHLDGTNCLSVGGTPIETNAAYSVSAWVRMDAVNNTTERVLAQLSTSYSQFQLWYSASADLWYFSVIDANRKWYSAGAAPTAELGEWEHVAATYDPDAGVIRLYLGGELAAEQSAAFAPWNDSTNLSVGCMLSDLTNTAFNGAIDEVGVWQGLLTQEQIKSAMADLPVAYEQARWTFKSGGDDKSAYGDRDLEVPETVGVGVDPFLRPDGAAVLNGEDCMEYASPVVDSDRSYTIAGWVNRTDPTRLETFISTAGEHATGLRLRGLTNGTFQLRLASSDVVGATGFGAISTTVAEAEEWYHLIGVLDYGKRELRLYINGVLESTKSIPATWSLWNATGATTVGCAGQADAPARSEFLLGALHDVRVWRGAVDPADISTMLGNKPLRLAAWWDFNSFQDGSDEPGDPTVDASGYGHTLTFSGTVDPLQTGYNSELDNALGFYGVEYARADGAVIDTDESFTIATWMRVDDPERDGVAISILGQDRSTITIKYSAANKTWQFAAPPTTSSGWQVAETAAAPSQNPYGYTLVTGVFDLPANELRLYINGALAATTSGVVLPASNGTVVIGAEGYADGTIRDGLVGAVDNTIIWQGELQCATIATMFDPKLHETVC